MNRELKQRVRPVHGITAHKPIVKQDIKLTAKIIQNLDSKWKLWEDVGEEKKDAEKVKGRWQIFQFSFLGFFFYYYLCDLFHFYLFDALFNFVLIYFYEIQNFGDV